MMNAFLDVSLPFSESVIERLGWVLIHSVWQFTLIALLGAAVLRLMRHSSAEARSGALIVLLLLSMACPIGTWLLQASDRASAAAPREDRHLIPHADAPPIVHRLADRSVVPTAERGAEDRGFVGAVSPPTFSTAVDTALQSMLTDQVASTVKPWLAWMVGFWALGVVLFSLRPLMGWLTLRRLKRVGVSPASSAVLAALTRASKRLDVRRSVRLLESSVAKVPLVVGYLRPVILLPIGLLTNIPVTQLEAILAHELAHIRRHDFVMNLLQILIETLFFYHPAMWWLSHRMRVEREHCCDDLVVRMMNNRGEYGRALIAIEELRGRSSALALGASDGSLLARVRRIAGHPNQRTGHSACIGICVLVCLVGTVLALGLLGNRGVAAMDESISAEALWGEPVNGLRIRVVPVRADMSEEDVDMNAVRRKFESQKQVAFAIEMENVSDQPIKVLDTGYGNSFGDSSGKPNTNWYGQFLFTIEYFDADGNKIEYPLVEHVTPDMILGSAKVSEIAPGASHRFLIRPEKWRSIHYQRLPHRKYTAVVHYHGMSKRAADRIRARKPDDEVLGTWSGDVASVATAFQIARPKLPPTMLYWGEPDNGLRAAMSFAEVLPWYGHGQKLDLLLHIQNVSEKPITLCSEMWLSTADLAIQDEDGNPVRPGATVSRGGITPMCRTTLQPQQTIVLGAGSLGVAKTQQQADTFDDVSHGAIVVPTGEYRLRLMLDSRRTPRMEDGQGNRLPPLEGDYVGKLTTGRKYLFLKDRPFDMEAKEVENASTPRQWAEIYVDYVRDRRSADGTYPSSVFDALRKSLKEHIKRYGSANQDLEPGADAWEAAIDAKDSWTHEELLAHVLEISEWNFLVVAGAHRAEVESSKYAQGVPRPGRMPAAGELERLPFGEAMANGLRVAWVFDSEGLARIGQPIGGRMVFHNSGKQPVTFTVEPWGWANWKVHNQHGNPVGPQHIPLAYWVGSYVRFRLEPGQIADTIGEPIGFGELSEVDHSLATTWIRAKPGDVLSVGGHVRLEQVKDRDGKPLKSDFAEPLPIKERTFAITAATGQAGASSSAHDPAAVWAGYFVDQISYRRNKDGTFPSSAFKSLKKYLAAYEIRGRHVDEWIAKADSKEAWPRDEFFAHVKDIATWSISTVHHAHAEEQRAVMNIPKPGRKPRDGELDDLPFGPAESNGLRVAWVFANSKGKSSSQSESHRIGGVLKSRIVFHNSGTKPVTFSSLQWPDANWELRDDTGNTIAVSRIMETSLNFDWQRFRLLPGQLIEIEGQPVGLGKHKGYGPALAKVWFPGKAGRTIKVSGQLPLDAAHPVGGGIFDHDWREPITLKVQTLTLTAATDAAQSAPAAAAPALEGSNVRQR